MQYSSNANQEGHRRQLHQSTNANPSASIWHRGFRKIKIIRRMPQEAKMSSRAEQRSALVLNKMLPKHNPTSLVASSFCLPAP
jgi:hypothetical protein